MERDVIAAIATGMTNSGIGIVRISGDGAFNIIDKIFKTKGMREKKLSQVQSHTVHYGYIVDDDEIVDEVLVVILKAPKSYTTEDTVEINTHGGSLVMRRILELVLKNGARLAEPGEYTKRAFLNGRIDLSQAESVMDVIGSRSDLALKNSVKQLSGALKKRIESLMERLIHEIAFIESALDDPEHISLEGYREILEKILVDMEKETGEMIASSEDGRRINEGIKTVILGKPNVGKSSILNALLQKDRAIVTDIAGTTRDSLEESLIISGLNLNIVDTAGIRDTKDEVERIGVSRSFEQTADADVILFVCDASRDLSEEDRQIIDFLSKERDENYSSGEKKEIICLLNKSDLGNRLTRDDIKSLLDCDVIEMSAAENTGFDELKDVLTNKFYSGNISYNDDLFITNIRHKNLIEQAHSSLELAIGGVRDSMPEDLITIDMMDAYTALGKVIGKAVEEDLVNEIFSKFCMGK